LPTLRIFSRYERRSSAIFLTEQAPALERDEFRLMRILNFRNS